MAKYYTISEASEKLGVSNETLRRWDKNGKFRSVRHPINNYRVYTEDQIQNLVEELQLDLEYGKNDKQNTVSLEPYCQTDNGQLFLSDATEMLSRLGTNSVDLIFADPPYNIKKAEWDTFESQKAYVNWCRDWVNEAKRVLKPTGSLFICGFSEILADLKWAFAPMFKGCKWLVWHYRNKANLRNDWGRSHESILHFRMSRDFKFNIDNVRIPYNKHTLKYPGRSQAQTSQYSSNGKQYQWEPHPLGAKPKDVFDIPTIANSSWEKVNHPTQKPVELLRKVILASSQEGEMVVDPFGGSGTTYAVAEAYGRYWKGAEVSEEYCELISQRLSNREHIQRIASEKDEVESQERRKKLKG